MITGNIPRERFHLLSTFKAIYDNGSISDAADVLGVTQSAISKHLQKLRDWFEDELFVRTASGMEPTAKAVVAIERVEHILQEMALLTDDIAFDTQTLQGTFTIATTSEVCQRLTPQLLRQLSTQAPKLRITIMNLAADYSIRELESGKVDLVISVNWHAPDHLMQKRLFQDRFVCLMSKGHPLVHNTLSLDDYVSASHIMVAPLGKQRGFIDDQLAGMGLNRLVRLSVPDFSQLETHLLDGEHIVTLPNQVALSLCDKHELLIKPLPMDVPAFSYYVFWHKRFLHEKSNRWMRQVIQEILAE